MITKKRVTIYLLIICIVLGVAFTGCNTDKDEVTEESYDFNVFLGSLDEPIEIDAMLTEYEKKTGLHINPIVIPEGKDNERTLEELLEDTTPPAVYAVANDMDTLWLSKGGFIADFSSIDSEESGQSRPYILDGYGFTYDKAVFQEVFGNEKYTSLIADLKACNYEEWTKFLEEFNNFINDKKVKAVTVNGNKYSFPKKKGTEASKLNGIFALPGADSQIYGYSIMNMISQTADINAWETAKSSTASAFQVMYPTLTTYIEGMDFMTSNLAGKYSSGIRGSDFVNEEYYSQEITDSIFMSGKSLFTILDSKKYSEIQSLNAKKAETLDFMPIKMPYDPALGNSLSTGAILNSSIPANVSYSLYINNKLPIETQKQALEFLKWFVDKEEQWGNPLTSSIKEYVDSGNILEYRYDSESIKEWEETIFDDKGVRIFLRKELWSVEYKEDMKLYFVEKWCDE